MEKLLLTSIDQVGIVVKDIQKTMDYYSSTFGIGPFRVVDMNIPGVIARGEVIELKLKLAFAEAGPVEIELIESIEGENIYTEFLRSKGEGLHHLGIKVDDVDKEVAGLKERGVAVLQQGKVNGRSFAYLDTGEPGGVIFELIPSART